MKFMKEEDAVSPVIGVILMVAITVILAAVIAAFVFGLGSGVTKTKNIGVTAKQVGAEVELTFQGGADAGSVSYFNVTVGTGSVETWTPIGIGDTELMGTASDAPDHVVVVAHFDDGSEQVILDTTV